MIHKTPFYNSHLKTAAKLVEFCGYMLPINYGSQIKEHEAVRNDCGMFDVSHMQVIDLFGADTTTFLRYLLSNDVNKLRFDGKALYTTMLNASAGIIDDLIVYKLGNRYRIIANAGTREKDLSWISSHASKFGVDVLQQTEFAMLAIQGPNAISRMISLRPHLTSQLNSLKPFCSFSDDKIFYARTGYTGENGLEILIPNDLAESFWDELIVAKVTPCGLGARDTLRLEAGMNLYGHDMNEDITPLECGLDWVVDLSDANRDFIGKDSYIKLKNAQNSDFQTGIVLTGKGVLREGQVIFSGDEKVGIVTSGTFSPTLKASIAMARIKHTEPANITVDIRGSKETIQLVNLPFVRNGKILVEISPKP